MEGSSSSTIMSMAPDALQASSASTMSVVSGSEDTSFDDSGMWGGSEDWLKLFFSLSEGNLDDVSPLQDNPVNPTMSDSISPPISTPGLGKGSSQTPEDIGLEFLFTSDERHETALLDASRVNDRTRPDASACQGRESQTNNDNDQIFRSPLLPPHSSFEEDNAQISAADTIDTSRGIDPRLLTLDVSGDTGYQGVHTLGQHPPAPVSAGNGLVNVQQTSSSSVQGDQVSNVYHPSQVIPATLVSAFVPPPVAPDQAPPTDAPAAVPSVALDQASTNQQGPVSEEDYAYPGSFSVEASEDQATQVVDSTPVLPISTTGIQNIKTAPNAGIAGRNKRRFEDDYDADPNVWNEWDERRKIRRTGDVNSSSNTSSQLDPTWAEQIVDDGQRNRLQVGHGVFAYGDDCRYPGGCQSYLHFQDVYQERQGEETQERYRVSEIPQGSITETLPDSTQFVQGGTDTGDCALNAVEEREEDHQFHEAGANDWQYQSQVQDYDDQQQYQEETTVAGVSDAVQGAFGLGYDGQQVRQQQYWPQHFQASRDGFHVSAASDGGRYDGRNGMPMPVTLQGTGTDTSGLYSEMGMRMMGYGHGYGHGYDHHHQYVPRTYGQAGAIPPQPQSSMGMMSMAPTPPCAPALARGEQGSMWNRPEYHYQPWLIPAQTQFTAEVPPEMQMGQGQYQQRSMTMPQHWIQPQHQLEYLYQDRYQSQHQTPGAGPSSGRISQRRRSTQMDPCYHQYRQHAQAPPRLPQNLPIFATSSDFQAAAASPVFNLLPGHTQNAKCQDSADTITEASDEDMWERIRFPGAPEVCQWREWVTTERPCLDDDGRPVKDASGKPVMIEVTEQGPICGHDLSNITDVSEANSHMKNKAECNAGLGHPAKGTRHIVSTIDSDSEDEDAREDKDGKVKGKGKKGKGASKGKLECLWEDCNEKKEKGSLRSHYACVHLKLGYKCKRCGKKYKRLTTHDCQVTAK